MSDPQQTPTGPWGPGYSQPAQPGYGHPQPGQPASPVDSAPPYGTPQHGAPQYGTPQYGTPQYGTPQYGTPQYGTSPIAPQGYRPPPVQRGIIPLRPLSLGELFDGAFRAVRANPRVMFGFTGMVVAITVTIQGLTQWLLLGAIAGQLTGVTSEIDPTGQFGIADSVGSALAQGATLPLLSLATTVLTGVLIASVSRSVIGQSITVGELWAAHWRRTLWLVVFSAVSGLLVAVVWVALAVPVIALAAAEQWAAAVLLGIVGGLALVVATVWFQIRILLIPPALVLEGTSVRDAVTRGWALTRGSFWRIFGIYLLTSIITGFVAQVIIVPVTTIATLVLQDPTATSGGAIAIISVGTALVYTLTIVFMAAVVALLYIDIRIRREGLDVELIRAAEAAAAV